MGLTDKGYVRRTYDDILNDKIQRAKELFGEDIDTSDLTPLGKFIRINAYDQAIAEEEIEQVYFARFPNTASGQSLDRLLIFAGISRNPATSSIYSVTVQGVPGTPIAPGFLLSTETGLTFWTTRAYTIGGDGTCQIEVSCTEPGTVGNLSSVKAINTVDNPQPEIISVESTACIALGVDEESDAELRRRFVSAVEGSGSCNETAIKAAILRVPTVQFATVIANVDSTEDSDGRPPHSFECYVLGGDEYEQEIAEAIFEKRPVGIRTVGDKAVTIHDVSGNERVVYYTPAPQVMITVRVSVKTTAAFPRDGIEQVKKAVADHINSLGIGTMLVLSSLYGHIYNVNGVQEVTTLELSTDGGSSYVTSNVSVPAYGIAICEDVLVEVAE